MADRSQIAADLAQAAQRATLTVGDAASRNQVSLLGSLLSMRGQSASDYGLGRGGSLTGAMAAGLILSLVRGK